jgi:hypothetical protein
MRKLTGRPAPAAGEAAEGHDHPDGSPAQAIMLADEPAAGLNPAASAASPDLSGSRRQDHSS